MSRGNQGLALENLGKREEALALLRQEERMCEELGDQEGLARSWGNQAAILSKQGAWEKALALHEREARLKQVLGDETGVATSWWNQGRLFQEQNRHEEAKKLMRQAIRVFRSSHIFTDEFERIWAKSYPEEELGS